MIKSRYLILVLPSFCLQYLFAKGVKVYSNINKLTTTALDLTGLDAVLFDLLVFNSDDRDINVRTYTSRFRRGFRDGVSLRMFCHVEPNSRSGPFVSTAVKRLLKHISNEIEYECYEMG